ERGDREESDEDEAADVTQAAGSGLVLVHVSVPSVADIVMAWVVDPTVHPAMPAAGRERGYCRRNRPARQSRRGAPTACGERAAWVTLRLIPNYLLIGEGMPVNLDAVGQQAGPVEVGWDSRDVMLYALGVGAGQADPLDELDLTTENTAGVQLRALPTFALILTQLAKVRPDFGDVDHTRLVHAEQSLELDAPMPVEGRARITGRIESIVDKGSGALVTTAFEANDVAGGRRLFTARASAFIRGEGGFDPNRKSGGTRPAVPDRAPDIEVRVPTRTDQALLYRLCADRNPLHSDPAFAAKGGFERPILHGLCTYGISTRVLLAALGAKHLDSISARFTKPVLPGEVLVVQGWRGNDAVAFRTLDASGT